MNTKSFIALTLLTIFAYSCDKKKKYEFWDLSKFNLVDNALEDKEAVKLIYACQEPVVFNEFKFYYHLIVISEKTGDTVNILSPVSNGLKPQDQNKIFNFFNQGNITTQLALEQTEKIKNEENGDNLNKSAAGSINKVIRDPRYDDMANNNFPSIIGIIGTLSKN